MQLFSLQFDIDSAILWIDYYYYYYFIIIFFYFCIPYWYYCADFIFCCFFSPNAVSYLFTVSKWKYIHNLSYMHFSLVLIQHCLTFAPCTGIIELMFYYSRVRGWNKINNNNKKNYLLCISTWYWIDIKAFQTISNSNRYRIESWPTESKSNRIVRFLTIPSPTKHVYNWLVIKKSN